MRRYNLAASEVAQHAGPMALGFYLAGMPTLLDVIVGVLIFVSFFVLGYHIAYLRRMLAEATERLEEERNEHVRYWYACEYDRDPKTVDPAAVRKELYRIAQGMDKTAAAARKLLGGER